ncbi:MAG: RnfABCDGE type electron transport complex subunit G [Paramuribaculum sp.]|nr:RnfABCDGE type electron transport complex subunit G [Paramuribaculum sp.]
MNKNSMIGMVVSLGVITVVAGALLGGADALTHDAVEKAQEASRVSALTEVLPEFDNNPVVEMALVRVGEDSVAVYPAKMCGRNVGNAVEITAHDGFSGDISLMFGFDSLGVVSGYTVLAHGETPGLGARMGEWFRDSVGNRSVVGCNPQVQNITVAKDGGEIDGITAATITSRAFLGALNNARRAVDEFEKDSQR